MFTFFSVFSLFTCRLRHIRSHLKVSLLSAVVSFIVMFCDMSTAVSVGTDLWVDRQHEPLCDEHARSTPQASNRLQSFFHKDNNDCTGILQLWCSKEPCGTAVGFVQMSRVLERDLVRTLWNMLS